MREAKERILTLLSGNKEDYCQYIINQRFFLQGLLPIMYIKSSGVGILQDTVPIQVKIGGKI